MANIICEYKHDKNPQKGKIRPLWLDEGGVWYDKDNYTYVGVVKDPEVKVPETVVRFTKESFVERQLDLHDRYPFKKHDPEDEEPRPVHAVSGVFEDPPVLERFVSIGLVEVVYPERPPKPEVFRDGKTQVRRRWREKEQERDSEGGVQAQALEVGDPQAENREDP